MRSINSAAQGIRRVQLAIARTTNSLQRLAIVSQTVATKYEVLCEHKLAAQAREMLLRMPGARAAAFE